MRFIERMALVVEIKRCKKIEHDIIQEVREKVASLEVSRELSVRTALVYDGILSPSVVESISAHRKRPS